MSTGQQPNSEKEAAIVVVSSTTVVPSRVARLACELVGRNRKWNHSIRHHDEERHTGGCAGAGQVSPRPLLDRTISVLLSSSCPPRAHASAAGHPQHQLPARHTRGTRRRQHEHGKHARTHFRDPFAHCSINGIISDTSQYHVRPVPVWSPGHTRVQCTAA